MRKCKSTVPPLASATTAREWHHIEQGTILRRQYTSMRNAEIRAPTNGFWKNLTASDKQTYLGQEHADAASKLDAYNAAISQESAGKCKSISFSSTGTTSVSHYLPVDTLTSCEENRASAQKLQRQDLAFSLHITSCEEYANRPLPRMPTKDKTPCSAPSVHLDNASIPAHCTSAIMNLIGQGRGSDSMSNIDSRWGYLDTNDLYTTHHNDTRSPLYGFSDGSVVDGGSKGSYSWIIGIKDANKKMSVLAYGGGNICSNDNLNTKITSARLEALGLLAGMQYAQHWRGKVHWKIDNTSVISTFRKVLHIKPRDWIAQSDRDVYGCIAALKPDLAAKWHVTHQKAHVEKSGKKKADWTFDERGNFYADKPADETTHALQMQAYCGTMEASANTPKMATQSLVIYSNSSQQSNKTTYLPPAWPIVLCFPASKLTAPNKNIARMLKLT
jgi:hypothetical protein